MNELTFNEVRSIEEIGYLRNQYLDELFEAQELYLELKTKNSKIFTIISGSKTIGYFILDNDGILLEYYIIQECIDYVDRIFGEIIKKFFVIKALCKSFDHTLLSCCTGLTNTFKVIGIHFREHKEKYLPPLPKDIIIRLAKPDDEQTLKEMNEEIFETDDEIREYIEKEKIFIFEKDNDILGFGIFSRVIEERPEFDIGMLVNKKYRRQGLGSLIIRYLVNYCKGNGWRPICGCAIENGASRKCLERTGFIARYRLLEFTFAEIE